MTLLIDDESTCPDCDAYLEVGRTGIISCSNCRKQLNVCFCCGFVYDEKTREKNTYIHEHNSDELGGFNYVIICPNCCAEEWPWQTMDVMYNKKCRDKKKKLRERKLKQKFIDNRIFEVDFIQIR